MRQMLRDQHLDSSATCHTLHHWLVSHPKLNTVAVYSPLPGEVDLASVIQLHPNIRWVFPKVCGDDLTFHRGDHLVPGAFGILEPHRDSPVVPLSEIDAIICPGLAFDSKGGRLGRGKGFYDRLLAKVRPDTIKIGICFAEQLVSDTFPEAHDIAMDEVITGAS